jgi:3-hydroxyisobutyrate dehydrogenase
VLVYNGARSNGVWMAERNPERIGYIGLGDMGGPMAENLAQAGVKLAVFDVQHSSMQAATDLGATPTASIRELAERSDIVFVCVRAREHLDDVLSGPDGLFATWKARNQTGAEVQPLIVMHSTFSPQVIQALGETAAEHSAAVLDAPVSGGRRGSVAGTLTLMVSGSRHAFARCRPFFDVVAGNVFFIGEQLGQGQVAKLCNNTMTLCNLFATIEAAKLAEAYGVDETMLVEVAGVSTGDSWYVRNWDFLETTMSTHTSTDISSIQARFTKDLLAASAAAEQRGVMLPYAAAAAVIGRSLLAERKTQFETRSRSS